MNLLFISSFFFLSSALASESMIFPKKEIPQSALSSSVRETPETSSDFAAEAKVSSDFAQETRTSPVDSVPAKPSPEKKVDDELELSEDFEMKNDSISEKYFAGAFLIYDCEEKHWVCVLEEDYKVCEDKRKESVEKKERQLSCAPIGEFPTKRSCFQRQLYMAGHAHGYRFCLLDEIKKEELE